MDPRLRLSAFYAENIQSHEASVQEFPCTLEKFLPELLVRYAGPYDNNPFSVSRDRP